MSTDVDIDAIDAELCRIDPKRKPLDERAKESIREFVRNAPPFTDAQARRIAQLMSAPRIGQTAS